VLKIFTILLSYKNIVTVTTFSGNIALSIYVYKENGNWGYKITVHLELWSVAASIFIITNFAYAVYNFM